MIILTLRCKIHPRYRALIPPKPGLGLDYDETGTS